MPTLTDRFEKAEEVLALSPPMLGGFLLEHLETIRGTDIRESERSFEMTGTCYDIAENYKKRGFGRTKDLSRAIAEAWNWLLVEGHLALDPEQSGHLSCFVTRRGIECSTHEGVEQYQQRRLFSADLLTKTIQNLCFADYLAGDFESAVLKAFRQVEIEVRTAGGYPAGDSGTSLVRKAFSPEPKAGPLTLSSEIPGEQQAMSDLFAGAIGRFRNPAAHGTRTFNDPIEAAELLLFASHLIGIVHERKP